MEYVVVISVFWGAIFLACLLRSAFFKTSAGYKKICIAVVLTGILLWEIADSFISGEQMFSIIATIDILIWLAIVASFVILCFRNSDWIWKLRCRIGTFVWKNWTMKYEAITKQRVIVLAFVIPAACFWLFHLSEEPRGTIIGLVVLAIVAWAGCKQDKNTWWR